jgi:Cys-tRNA(Pro)/Cys-tRNA(Cys) deacylase
MNLEAFLEHQKIWYQIIHKDPTIHTADAAKATGINVHRITKNLVTVTNKGEYVLLIVPGDRKVDMKTAAKALNVQRITLVPFDKAMEISGYPPGGTPSVGHKTKMRVVIDVTIMEYETVYCGGGSRDKLIELKTIDIMQLNHAITAKIAKLP